ncbi:DUF1579 family protein [Rhodanobacter umsongensis]|uniref:DUF1579 family protein n=1 Tax=Rhodanobacter umsongensis TaxID=633153 RepID=A0ABW0JGS8_9GAMM
MNKRSATARGWVLATAMALATGLAVARAGTSAATPRTDSPCTRLASLSGHWTVRQSMWTDPAAPPVIDHGAATYAMVLGGHHLQQNLRIASDKPFEGLGFIGYEDATGKYYSSWMDTHFSGIVLVRGDYDASSRSYTFAGEMANKGGAPIPVREVMRIADNDHFVYEYYETRNGKEALAVSLQYTRVD